MRASRNRIVYFLFLAVTVALGFSCKFFATEIPELLSSIGAIFLWPLMIFFLLGFLFPGASIMRNTLLTILLTVGFEFSQQITELENLRSQPATAFFFGDTFYPLHFVIYFCSLIVGIMVEIGLLGNFKD